MSPWESCSEWAWMKSCATILAERSTWCNLLGLSSSSFFYAKYSWLFFALLENSNEPCLGYHLFVLFEDLWSARVLPLIRDQWAHLKELMQSEVYCYVWLTNYFAQGLLQFDLYAIYFQGETLKDADISAESHFLSTFAYFRAKGWQSV